METYIKGGNFWLLLSDLILNPWMNNLFQSSKKISVFYVTISFLQRFFSIMFSANKVCHLNAHRPFADIKKLILIFFLVVCISVLGVYKNMKHCLQITIFFNYVVVLKCSLTFRKDSNENNIWYTLCHHQSKPFRWL